MSLGDERLGTTDESGGRLFLHPAEVKGIFRRYRTVVHILLLCVFLAVPWVHWNGLQLILLDIPNRTFIFFGILLKSHDAPMLFLLLAIGGIGLAAVTAVFGRIWCGWACPQTVFIDAIYRQIEVMIQGKYFKRRKLQAKSLGLEKFIKLGLTWICFIIVSTVIAHSFVAYFVGSERLLEMMQGSPEENKTAFLIVLSMTLLLLFDFGWFREQFCIIACPYGRFQSVLMDSSTTTVLYDYNRGEPRKGLAPMGSRGDCVNCRRCVEVCPTGIDIRRGIQMECIGCTACIDACDDIMTKVKKPVGLIRYASEEELISKTDISLKKKLITPRVIIYVMLIILLSGALIFSLRQHQVAAITLLRKSSAPYVEQTLSDGSKQIINHISLHLHNQGTEELNYTMSASVLPPSVEVIIPVNSVKIQKNSSTNFSFIIKFKKELLGSQKKIIIPISFDVSGEHTNVQLSQEINLVGPN